MVLGKVATKQRWCSAGGEHFERQEMFGNLPSLVIKCTMPSTDCLSNGWQSYHKMCFFVIFKLFHYVQFRPLSVGCFKKQKYLRSCCYFGMFWVYNI